MGMAILRGTDGVSVIRLPSGEWSAPCAICLESVSGIAPQQETVLLFMSEVAIYSLVTRANVALNQTHRFEPGPFGSIVGQESIDIYVYVRFNGGFTPSELIAANMVGWIVKEDTARHTKWHGDSVTWFDVLTNKISVDRSSVGNALYLVLNLAAGSAQDTSFRNSTKKNYADVESWVNVAPSFKKSVAQVHTPAYNPGEQQNSYAQQMPIYYDNMGQSSSVGYTQYNVPLNNQMYMNQGMNQINNPQNNVYSTTGNIPNFYQDGMQSQPQNPQYNNPNFPYGQYGYGPQGQ